MPKNYSIKINLSIPVRRFWTMVVPAFFLVCIAGTALGILLIDDFILPNLPGMNPRGMVTVPDLVKQPSEKAREALYAIGLRMDVAEKAYNTQLPPGSIITQDPASGESVKKGRHIQVVISRGGEIGMVPNVMKQTEHNARVMLLKAGFDNITVKRIYSDTWSQDQVFVCEPNPGTTISREIKVAITVSRGAEPTYVEVPDLSGLILSEAQNRIEEVGLVLGYVEHRRGSGRAGHVVEQAMAAGSQVLPRSKINLVVGSE